MSVWKECTIADLGTVVGGATPSTKDSANYDNGTIAWLTPKDLSGYQGRYISRGERNITEKGLRSCSTQLMPRHTVLFSSRAPIGYVAIAENELCTNQGFKSIIPNENTDYLFLYYLLKYNKDAIENMGSGTTFKEVSGNTMRGIRVRVPSDIETQRRIAGVLGSIDDKIEQNIAINNNLLEQIRAICKTMVIDRSDVELSPISEHCIVVTKGTTPTTLGKPFVNQGINFIKAESILDDHSFDRSKFAYIDDETNQMLRRSIIQRDDIVYTIAGTLGRFALVDEQVLPANTNQAVAIIRVDKKKLSPEYLYSLFIADWQNEYYSKHIQQAVQANLSLTTIKSLPIPMLKGDAMKDYVSLITPIISKMKEIEHENALLSSTRDSLLPKLMSGELDVARI